MVGQPQQTAIEEKLLKICVTRALNGYVVKVLDSSHPETGKPTYVFERWSQVVDWLRTRMN